MRSPKARPKRPRPGRRAPAAGEREAPSWSPLGRGAMRGRLAAAAQELEELGDVAVNGLRRESAGQSPLELRDCLFEALLARERHGVTIVHDGLRRGRE